MGAVELVGAALISEVISIAENPTAQGVGQENEKLCQNELRHELTEILALTGDAQESLTLEQLRQALLVYLETIDQNMNQSESLAKN